MRRLLLASVFAATLPFAAHAGLFVEGSSFTGANTPGTTTATNNAVISDAKLV